MCPSSIHRSRTMSSPQNIGQFPTFVTVPASLATVVTHLKTTLGNISALEDTIKASAATVKTTKLEIITMAMNAGDDLIRIKAEVGHGKFRPWLESNVTCTPRTATKYM